jgi:hypothetical protein
MENKRKESDCKSKRLKESILNLYDNTSLSTSEIAKELNVSLPTIKKVAKENNISKDRTKISGSNCKSKRLKESILDLYNTNLTSSEIAKKLDLSTPTIKKVGRENGISKERLDKRPACVWLDEVRNGKIIEAIKSGEKYHVIAAEFKISRQRVYQFALANDLTRWKANRLKFEAIVEKINSDYDAGMSYDELVIKYDMNDASFKHRLQYYGLDSLVNRFREVRNTEIVKQYRMMPATSVVSNTNPILNDPIKINTVRSIYSISVKNGFRKYPNIIRGFKGIFVDPSVLKIIKARKNSSIRYTNQMIADELNKKGFKTSYGNEFLWHTVQNIWGKIQERGTKKSKIKYNKTGKINRNENI